MKREYIKVLWQGLKLCHSTNKYSCINGVLIHTKGGIKGDC